MDLDYGIVGRVAVVSSGPEPAMDGQIRSEQKL